MRSLYERGTTKRWIKQTTGIQNLDLGGLMSERVGVPSRDEQRRIADHLDAETARIDALIDAKQQMIDQLLARRAAETLAGVGGEHCRGSRAPSAVPWLTDRPAHWREAKLTLLATLGSGHTPSRSHPEWWTDCVIPWITTGEVAQMRSDRIENITNTREQISHLGLENSSAVIHPAGTVVLCRTAASAGYSAIMADDMAVSQDIVTWRCGPNLHNRYLLLCLRAMRADLLQRLAMGSTHKTIYMPEVESIRIPLPPIEEQLRIVDEVWGELRRIDDLTDTLTRQIELLRERRQALITAAVTGEMAVP